MPRLGALALKIQLYAGAEPALGPGRADVLEAIATEGSISAAGRSLGMSYRFTWNLVDSMNRCFVETLVDASAGGRHGGGAILTEAGKRVLTAYRALENQLVKAAQGEHLAALNALLSSSASEPSHSETLN